MTAGDAQAAPRLVVLIPIYNDWAAAGRLIEDLSAQFHGARAEASVLLVDDGSTQSGAPELGAGSLPVQVLRLKRNLGHQRAIGVGLAWLAEHWPCDAVVVMDGDGEDDPADAVRLVHHWEELGRDTIVFAERTRRSEGLVFRASYLAFRVVHRLFTGLGVRVGNFSVLPFARLRALVTVPDLWNHYAAAVFVSRLPFVALPTTRAKRLAGHSSMNFPALVMHGLSAIAVFGEIVSARVLLATLAGILVTTVALLAVVAIRLFTELAIPGWATFTAGLLLLLLVQGVMFSILFSFIMLANRKGAAVILGRDYHLFVDTVRGVAGSAGADREAVGPR